MQPILLRRIAEERRSERKNERAERTNNDRQSQDVVCGFFRYVTCHLTEYAWEQCGAGRASGQDHSWRRGAEPLYDITRKQHSSPHPPIRPAEASERMQPGPGMLP